MIGKSLFSAMLAHVLGSSSVAVASPRVDTSLKRPDVVRMPYVPPRRKLKQPNHEKQAAAQAKRDRKNAKRVKS